MDDLYETNFQSNGEFYQIRIRYSVIRKWSTMDILEFAYYFSFYFLFLTFLTNVFEHDFFLLLV
jgi:hypothetical protein